MTVEDVVFRPAFNQILLLLKSITTANKPSVPINKNKGRGEFGPTIEQLVIAW